MTLRVLATDVHERSMLAAVRCLHDTGFRVCAVATRHVAPGLWSRASSERAVVPNPGRTGEGFISGLEGLLRRRPCNVLLLGTDISLLVVSRYRERLQPYTNMGLPSHATVEASMNKAYVAAEAAKVDLSAPPQEICSDADTAAAAADAFGYPVLVKPVHTVVVREGQARRWGAELARDSDAVRIAAAAFGACIVQTRVSGRVISFGGVATHDGLLAFVVSRYLRMWPPEVGNAAFSETICPPAGLVEAVEALVRSLGWVGLFELELLEREDGRLAAIDFTPRAYGSMTLAAAAGVPLASLWCRWLMGERPRSTPARVGVRYRWEDGDFRHLVWQLQRGRRSAALGVLRPRPRVVHAYFRASDPGPLIARGLQLPRLAPTRMSAERMPRPSQSPPQSLEEARRMWTPLAEATRNIFSTWEWADLWWKHFGAGRSLDLRVVRSNGRTTVLPVYVERRAGFSVRRFIGHGVGDQLGPVGVPQDAVFAMAELASGLRGMGVLLAERMPADREWASNLGGRVIHSDGSPLIDCAGEGSWEDYLRERSATFRQQVRRRARRLLRLGVQFRLARDPGRLQGDLDALIRLHRARWGGSSQAFENEREAFHRAFAAVALERGWLRLWFAEAGGVPVAAWYGFRFAGVESYYQSGRDPAWDRHSVGAGILEHSIREAFEDGMREYRMLRGDETYKRRYTQLDAPLETVAVSHGTIGRAVVSGVGVVARAAAGRRLLNRLRD